MNSPAHLVVDRQFLSEGGEMGRLMRNKNWSESALGPIDSWPQSLRTIVSVCLNSRFPLLIWWGKEFVNIYNDALQPLLGEENHPSALGAPGKDMWISLWDVAGPMLERVYYEGKSATLEHQLLLLHRHGYTEECYFTFSFSPIYDESGTVGGIFTAITETSKEVISARYLNTLKDLANSLAHKRDEADLYRRAIGVVQKNDKDFPFVLIYKVNDEGNRATLVASTHEQPDSDGEICFEKDDRDRWGIRKVIESGKEVILEGLSGLDNLPSGAWKEGVRKILLLPVFQRGKLFPFGVLVIGLNPYQVPDTEGPGFYTLFADQIAREITDLRNDEFERKRAGPLLPLYVSDIQTPYASIHPEASGKSRQAGKRAEDFLRDVFEQAPVPMCFLKGPEFFIEQANSYMLDFWGKTSGEVLHQRIHDVFPEIVGQGVLVEMRRVFETGQRFRAEEAPLDIMRYGQMDHRYVSFVYEPFKESDGKVTAIVVVGHDVTQLVISKKDAQRNVYEFQQEIAAQTSELKNKNEELELKNAELEQFNFLSSHDLQEPLRKIQTFSGLMLYNLNDHHTVEKYVNKIVGSVARMSVLIQSLLDYSRLSQAKNVFVPVDLNQILKSVLEDFELLIAEKNCSVKSADLPVVPGDPRQLGQLFSNLIHNAFKFCDVEPEIEISWHHIIDDEKELLKLPVATNFICLKFSDNGTGFDQRYSEKAFEMFQRLHSPIEYPGTGIGLSFCKKIVENHRGLITVESKLGAGSHFRVYLPV